MPKLTTLAEAYDIIDRKIRPKRNIQEISLRDALGYILAEDIVSPVDIPPFDRAAMDGYAVISTDLINASPESPKLLRVIGSSEIGSPFRGHIRSGEAVYVHTGSEIPVGADVVVPLEFAERMNYHIVVRRSFAKWENISRRGEDVKKGETILFAGTVLQPYDIAFLKSIGLLRIPVLSKPRAIVFATGNELVDEPEHLEPGKILEYTREIVIGYLRRWGFVVEDLGIIPDDPELILDKLLNAGANADLVVTTGGTSVGKKDYMPRIIKENGDLFFHGLAVQPGKPICVGTIAERPIVCLPGLPVAAFVGIITVLRYTASKILGVDLTEPPKITAILSRRVWSKPGIKSFVRVKLRKTTHGVYAEPLLVSGSGVLSSVVLADGIIVVPEDKEGFDAGSKVEVLLLRHNYLQL